MRFTGRGAWTTSAYSSLCKARPSRSKQFQLDNEQADAQALLTCFGAVLGCSKLVNYGWRAKGQRVFRSSVRMSWQCRSPAGHGTHDGHARYQQKCSLFGQRVAHATCQTLLGCCLPASPLMPNCSTPLRCV